MVCVSHMSLYIYNVLAERLDKSGDPVCCTLAAVRVSSEETNKDTLRLIWYGTTIHIRQVVWLIGFVRKSDLIS